MMHLFDNLRDISAGTRRCGTRRIDSTTPPYDLRQVSRCNVPPMGDLPLLFFLLIAVGPPQSRTSQMTIVLSFPPVTSVGLSSFLVKAEARIRPWCALKVDSVS